MSYAKIVFLVLAFSLFVNAKMLSCWISSPCGWVDPVPGTNGKYLGYCIEKVEGSGQYLQVFRKSRTGQPLSRINLKITELNSNRLTAVSSDKMITLNAGKYHNFWAGGLLVKSSTYQNGLGFQTACDYK